MASEKKLDVFGVGNAIVDVLAQVPDKLVAELELPKGSMNLMNAAKQAEVLNRLEHDSLQLASGGSAANTMATIARCGGTGIYVGQVAHDPHGEFYRNDMRETGIEFPVELQPETGLPTATSVILTTPDAERTMCTHLGVSTCLEKSSVDFSRIADCSISYVEGYLWDAEDPRAVCVETFEQSKKHGVRTSFTFSDPFLVDRFPDDFARIVDDYCDIVFCNADEARKFFDTDDLDECNRRLAERVELSFVTDGAHGCYVVSESFAEHVAGFSVKAIDTVGAGDAFAGGVLYGLTHDLSPVDAARWGNFCAAEVVARIGPRLDRDLKPDLEKMFAGQSSS